MTILLEMLATLLAIVAAALSFYFLGVYSRWFSPTQKWVPTFCRTESDSCTSIVDSDYGRIFFNVPNAFWGILGELGLAELAYCAMIGSISVWIPIFVSGLFLLFGIYLIYGLVRLKTSCSVCLTVHTLNLIIFILLVL